MKLPKTPRKTTTSFAFKMVERTLVDGLMNRAFASNQHNEVVRFFGTGQPRCAFCGSPNVTRWDHLIPVSMGGDTVLGNMVLACQHCDDSKSAKPWKEWVNSDTPASPRNSKDVGNLDTRIDLIKRYVAYYKYVSVPLENRLNQEELSHYKRLQTELARLRTEADTLIKGYQSRRRRG